MGTTPHPDNPLTPLLGPEQTEAERGARKEAEGQLGREPLTAETIMPASAVATAMRAHLSAAGLTACATVRMYRTFIRVCVLSPPPEVVARVARLAYGYEHYGHRVLVTDHLGCPVSRPAADPIGMREPLTAETITDAEIRGLRADGAIDHETFGYAYLRAHRGTARGQAALARCVEILNARAENGGGR